MQFKTSRLFFGGKRLNLTVLTRLSLLFLVLTAVISATEARGKNEEKLLSRVWGAIKLKTPAGTLKQIPSGLTISLKAADGSYTAVIDTTQTNDVKRALSGNEFLFMNVPTETTMHLEMVYKSPSGSTDRYFGAFVFHYPKTNIVQDKEKALRIAGYTGDFEINLEPAKITYSSRY
ncbi:MAG: hypothetical protein PHP01_08760 [Phycisphaerae bacterium]|nr:hypothetical protein [Phycisphaerae bacterium]